MKNLQTLLLILTAALFFTACQKDEAIENYDSISGVLTAGENVTVADFNSIQMVLGKLFDEVDTSPRIFTAEDFDFIRNTDLKADGSFTFENLDNGNYIVTPSEGFIFAIDTFSIVTIDGKTLNHLNKMIERGIPENCVCCW